MGGYELFCTTANHKKVYLCIVELGLDIQWFQHLSRQSWVSLCNSSYYTLQVRWSYSINDCHDKAGCLYAIAVITHCRSDGLTAVMTVIF